MDKRNLRAVRAGYDKISEEYARRSFQATPDERVDHLILDLLLTHVEGVVCDLGCGPGHNARYMRDRGAQVVGVDLSAGMLEQARRRNPDIDFLEANMYRLPVEAGTWGAVVALYSIIHIPRAEVVRVLREIWRVLQPGGLLLLAFYIGEATICTKRWWDVPVSVKYTHFRAVEMEKYLTLAGFHVEGNLALAGTQGQADCRYVFARKPWTAA